MSFPCETMIPPSCLMVTLFLSCSARFSGRGTVQFLLAQLGLGDLYRLEDWSWLGGCGVTGGWLRETRKVYSCQGVQVTGGWLEETRKKRADVELSF